MKKVLMSVIGVAALAGCSAHYDYYDGGVRYSQQGSDCVYYTSQHGRKFTNDINKMDENKRVIYRNTLCTSLYERDNGGNIPVPARTILTPAYVPMDTTPCAYSNNTCSKCNAPVLKRRYVIVSAI